MLFRSGRGMRIIESRDQIEKSYERCRSEARLAFGNDQVYVELLVPKARHIEVQVVGDGTGNVIHLWERDCSAQRQNQKIIEIAPSPNLPVTTRDALLAASLEMAQDASYRGVGTFEYLVNADNLDEFYFIETNARLQVEHTVSEAITGLDLVALQLNIAAGKTLPELGLTTAPQYQGFAIQSRINMETPGKKGLFKPTGGTISVFEPPSGPGIRVDTFGYTGYKTSTRYDSLLAKLIVHSTSDSFEVCARKTERALKQFRIEGFKVNIPFLITLVGEDDFNQGSVTTRYIDQHLDRLASASEPQETGDGVKQGLAGTKLKSNDPLAVLALGKSDEPIADRNQVDTLSSLIEGPEGSVPVPAPMQGTIIEMSVAEGDLVHKGQEMIVMDAMKMEHVIQAPVSGEIVMVTADVGDAIVEDHPILFISEQEVSEGERRDRKSVV